MQKKNLAYFSMVLQCISVKHTMSLDGARSPKIYFQYPWSAFTIIIPLRSNLSKYTLCCIIKGFLSIVAFSQTWRAFRSLDFVPGDLRLTVTIRRSSENTVLYYAAYVPHGKLFENYHLAQTRSLYNTQATEKYCTPLHFLSNNLKLMKSTPGSEGRLVNKGKVLRRSPLGSNILLQPCQA